MLLLWVSIKKPYDEENSTLLDYKKGFGGSFGVQNDRQDKSAVGFEHHEALSKHESQLHNKKVNSTDDQSRGSGEPEGPKFVREKPIITGKY